jgi:hypothetical protein
MFSAQATTSVANPYVAVFKLSGGGTNATAPSGASAISRLIPSTRALSS